MISTRWRIAILLFFAAGLNYADRMALASVIPSLREDIAITDTQIGIIGSLFLWSYAIMSPLAGRIADNYSRSRIIMWSLILWSLVTLSTGLVQDIMLLIALRILLGIFESFYLPAAGALLGEHHPPSSRGKAMGFHVLGLNLGILIGGAGAGVLAEYYGWRLGFWILGGLGLVLAAISTRILTDGPNKAVVYQKSTALQAWAYLVKVPSFYAMLISSMTAGLATWIFFTWLPLFFNENYGMAMGASGLAGVLLYKAPVVFGIGVGGWLSDRVAQREARGRAMLKALSFLLSCPFLYFFMGTPTFILLAAMLVISSAVRAIGVPSEYPIICDIVPSVYRSTAMGIMNTAATAAGGLGVLLAGMFKQTLGLNVIFGASAFLYAVTGGVMVGAYYLSMTRDVERASNFSAA
jgi:MFS transporter, Spinster family, sphingosine-1-phosphate transporter